jgi:DNA-binding transcriptional LysR family regulator
VTTTADLGATVVAEVTARYIKRYPGARVEVDLRTDIVDLVAEGFDLALRVTTKRLRDSSLLAQRIGSYALRLYASPVYLARRHEPRTLEDLREHSFVGLAPDRLKLTGIESRVDSSDFFFCRELLRAGTGIGALPPFLAAPEIATGELVQVLPRWAAPTGTAYVVQPSRKHQPAKSRVFRDLLIELFRERTLG